MAWSWSWVLVLGVVVSVGGVLTSRLVGGKRTSSPPPLWGAWFIGLGLAALAFLACLPTRAPFATGTQLGYGIALGAAAAVLALVLHRLARPTEEYATRVAAAAAMAGAAVIWIAVTELLFRADPQWTVLGGIIGGLLTMTPVLWARAQHDASFFSYTLTLAGLAALLGEARYSQAAERPFWALPVIPLAGGLLGLVIGALLLGRLRGARWVVTASAVVFAAAACLVNRALLHNRESIDLGHQFTPLLFVGWIIIVLIALAAASSASRRFSVAVPALLAVTGLIAAFNLGGGYGTSLMLAAALPLVLALHAGGDDRTESLPWFLLLGLLYLAFRLFLSSFEEWFRSGPTVEFGRHYGLVGIAAGMLWIGSLHDSQRSRLTLLSQVMSAVVVPAVLFFALGAEALAGLVVGLWLAQLALPLLTSGQWHWRDLPVTLLPLMAVVVVALPPWGEFMLDQPRLVRGLIVGIAAVLTLLVLALAHQRGPVEQSAQTAEG